jgi:hypothetical protein
MTSKKRAKGYRTVASGRKILESQGYIVANLEKTGKFIKDKDLWGLWDVLGIKEKEHLFIQFKTNLQGSKWKQPYIEFGQIHGSSIVKYEIWDKFDNKGFKITKCE